MNARLLIAAVALVVGPLAARADGLPSAPVSAPAATYCCEYVPAPDWTGVYVGIHGGLARSSSGWTFPRVESFNTAAGQNFSTAADGAFGGVHLGLNYQIKRILLGVETTYALNNLDETLTGPFVARPLDRFKTDIADLFTLTGRLGFAVDRFLIYGKAGFASSSVNVSAVSSTGLSASTDQRMNGWTAGGGVDIRILSDVLFGLEYNYLDLSGDRFTNATSGTVAGLPFTADIHDVQSHNFVARLSILFGPGACCHDGMFGKY